MPEDAANYSSGDDYALEFLGYHFSFGERDFEERVAAAAVRLGLVASNDLDEDEVGDLVELAADGRIAEARSPLGSYLVRHWERLALVDGESLVYWLRKLVFRGAYLDHRVKEGLLEVIVGRRQRRVRVRGAPGRPGAARARPHAVLACAAVPPLDGLGPCEADGLLRPRHAEPDLADRPERDDHLLGLVGSAGRS